MSIATLRSLKNFAISWLSCGISRCIDVCLQPWCNPVWFTGLKAPPNDNCHVVLHTLPLASLTTALWTLLLAFWKIVIHTLYAIPQWGAADAEIKVLFGENTELKRFSFKAWSLSVYSHTCYAYCQGFLLYLFYHSGPFTCIFFQNLPRFFSWVDCG